MKLLNPEKILNQALCIKSSPYCHNEVAPTATNHIITQPPFSFKPHIKKTVNRIPLTESPTNIKIQCTTQVKI